MRKFQTKGSSRRKTMKKIASTNARAMEMEFVAKLYKTISPPEVREPQQQREKRR